jgi:hypothetical protein
MILLAITSATAHADLPLAYVQRVPTLLNLLIIVYVQGKEVVVTIPGISIVMESVYFTSVGGAPIKGVSYYELSGKLACGMGLGVIWCSCAHIHTSSLLRSCFKWAVDARLQPSSSIVFNPSRHDSCYGSGWLPHRLRPQRPLLAV